MAKMTVIGVSASARGAISKAGNAYRIGQIHTMAPLAPPMAEGGVEKGAMGRSLRCDPELVYRVSHLSFPLVCDVDVEVQMRFGKPEETVLDVRPVELVKNGVKA